VKSKLLEWLLYNVAAWRDENSWSVAAGLIAPCSQKKVGDPAT
jgi:hypothetical protein